MIVLVQRFVQKGRQNGKKLLSDVRLGKTNWISNFELNSRFEINFCSNDGLCY
jgi:hypothetical protein